MATRNGLAADSFPNHMVVPGRFPGTQQSTGLSDFIVRVSFGTQKKSSLRMTFYGDPERTRTVDLQRDRLAC